MWNKTILIAFILLITNGGKLRAALPIRYLNTSSAAATSAETILENYELMKMDLSSSSGFANYSNRRFQNNYEKKCLTSKIGRGMMIGGGGLFLVGAVIVSSGDKDSLGGGMCIFVGLLGLIWGGILAIIGGIYNNSRNSRYSFVSPKSNASVFLTPLSSNFLYL